MVEKNAGTLDGRQNRWWRRTQGRWTEDEMFAYADRKHAVLLKTGVENRVCEIYRCHYINVLQPDIIESRYLSDDERIILKIA